MQEIFCFFDDSGVLHPSETSGRFVYAGFVFSCRSDKDDAKRKYIAANKQVCQATSRTDEIKAHGLAVKHKRTLYNSTKNYPSVSAEVDITRLRQSIVESKNSICRYKDFVLKLAIKNKVRDFILAGIIDPNKPVNMYINVDEQLTASDGRYKLKEAVYNELRLGTSNWNHGRDFPPLLYSDLEISLRYCESKHNFLIQASDILANRIWSSFRVENPEIRIIPNHSNLTFP